MVIINYYYNYIHYIYYKLYNNNIIIIIKLGLEWCGSQSYLFMAQKLLNQEQSIINSEKRIIEIEEKCKLIEGLLSKESGISNNLKKQLKQTQLNAEDNEWQLQEQLAQMNNILQLEKDSYNDIKNELSVTQGKLVEVEMYLTSDRGAITLQLERELADAKLKISELEAEKDINEIETIKRNKINNGNTKENIKPRMNNNIQYN